jgi:TetR/AcrR family transcriptional regulator, cholesterol catabolism regulator
VIPTTLAQQARYARVLSAAAEILSAEGGDAIQMKDLAQRAGVSLATLYRYFPSKDYVLLALAVARYQEAARKVFAETPRGSSVRERVTNYMLRDFHAQQRDKRLTATFAQALSRTRRDNSAIIETIEHLHVQIIRHVAAGEGTLSDRQLRVLPIVIDIFTTAGRLWLAGVMTAAEVEAEIKIGCELLELPDDVVAAELDRAAPDTRLGWNGTAVAADGGPARSAQLS